MNQQQERKLINGIIIAENQSYMEHLQHRRGKKIHRVAQSLGGGRGKQEQQHAHRQQHILLTHILDHLFGQKRTTF